MREKEFLPLVKERLGIEELNPMQRKMLDISSESRDILLLSPTGSGKTLAFALPLMKNLRPSTGRVQAVVVAPSRELVVQIAGILREIAKGFKVTALYGGHKVEDEVNSLSVTPDIIVATPGRLLDHAVRRNVDLLPVRILVLDEFDKCLELGFDEEMSKIVKRLKNVSRVILTSATPSATLPDFLNLNNPLTLDFLPASDEKSSPRSRMRVHRVDSDSRDKLETLLGLLLRISSDANPERAIIFVNHRESAERVAEFLISRGVDAVLYHGALDQREREMAVARFNNGSAPVLVATDLAARGLDIEKVASVIHYHQPLTPEAYTHRNGRTARVDASGDIYLLLGPDEEVKPFVDTDDAITVDPASAGELRSGWRTIYISAGKKEKLSKGDILGFLAKDLGLTKEEIGKIDLFDHYALVAVDAAKARYVAKEGSARKIKGTRRKFSVV